MITMQAVPIYRPPSPSCQRGAGKAVRSTSSPSTTFSSTAPVATSTGWIGSMRLPMSFQARMMSIFGVSAGSPSATAQRSAVPMKFVNTRYPAG
ncbi:Uncharacterised protein [Mycobacteroides abscessus subsp. abscessus]|nr:Uncharacterised protein [Mycobacteroides abscessus subsp. abscessus]